MPRPGFNPSTAHVTYEVALEQVSLRLPPFPWPVLISELLHAPSELYLDLHGGSTCQMAQLRRTSIITNKQQIPWSESASEPYRPSDSLSAKLVPTFVDRGCHMVSVTDPYGRILGFLDRSRYFSSK
jgi:hypothetical protein